LARDRPRPRPRGAAPPLRGVIFISVCGFSHRGTDDRSSSPRQPGFSHDHTFIGNTSTDAFSTPARLRTRRHDVQAPADRAGVLTPTLFGRRRTGHTDDRDRVLPAQRNSPLKPFPAGLQMVAGELEVDRPQRLTVTW
jgi:hypothetical protein